MSRHAVVSRRSQEDRRAEAERRLLEAAAELIGEIGTSRVTLAAIGERAGYSRGLVTHHFGSKSALMQRLVDVVTAEFRAALTEAAPSASPRDELHGLIGTFMNLVAERPPLHRAFLVLWSDAMVTSPDARPAMAASDRMFRGEIEDRLLRGVAAGDFPRDVDPRGLATVLLGLLRGVALQYVLDGDAVDLDASRREIEQLLNDRLRLAAAAEAEADPPV
ncbi:TetR/AcrR family transcriptional regulator [Streptomyces mirabilis]|uniref:TetR/AcrR family transcriptional regulator n=1 Tax=Streptomyces mirabilis TaxID=68239 RepID=UPI0036D91E6D